MICVIIEALTREDHNSEEKLATISEERWTKTSERSDTLKIVLKEKHAFYRQISYSIWETCFQIPALPFTNCIALYKLWQISFWGAAARSLFAVQGLILVAKSRGYSLVLVCGLLIAVASHCSGFSECRAQAVGYMGFSSCDTWLSYPTTVWNLGVGVEPVSLALAGRYLTTGPLGKSYSKFLKF